MKKEEKLIEALKWCSGSDDFQVGGKAREGWEKICLPLLRDDKKEANGFEDKEFLNAEEAAEFLNITKRMLYYLTYKKKIPYYKPGGKLIRFYKSELIKWIEKGRVKEEGEDKI